MIHSIPIRHITILIWRNTKKCIHFSYCGKWMVLAPIWKRETYIHIEYLRHDMSHGSIKSPLSSPSILCEYSCLLEFWSIRHSGKIFLESHRKKKSISRILIIIILLSKMSGERKSQQSEAGFLY